MIASYYRNIGEQMLDGDLLDVLLDKQKPYKSKYILICDIDVVTSKFQLSYEEYDINKKRQYLSGQAGGRSVNYSPYINISSNEKDYNKIDSKKFINEKKLRISETSKFEQVTDTDTRLFFKFYDKNKDEIISQAFEFFKSNFCKDSYGKQVLKDKKLSAKSILFKISGKYPGDIKSFVDLYTSFSLPDEIFNGLCNACGENKDVFPTDKINTAKFETFSLDQLSLVFGLHEKKSQQFHICYNCVIAIERGKQVCENELNYNAYTVKLDSKTTEWINHSTIPVNSGQGLKNILNILSRKRKQRTNDKKQSLRRQINDLGNQIKLVDAIEKKRLKSDLKKIEEDLKKFKTAHLSQRELLNFYSENKVSFYDMHYRLVSAGTSKKKEIVESIYINHSQSSRVIEWLKSTEKIFNKNKDTEYIFEFRDLFNVFDVKMGKKIQESLFTNKKISIRELAENANKNIYPNFMNKAFKRYDMSEFRKMNRPQHAGWQLKVFRFIIELFENANLLGDE